MRYLLGVDVGSSDCKTILIDESGRFIASASQPYPTEYPQVGWAEQDPQDWYDSACQSIRKCVAQAEIDPLQIAGLSVDGPAHNVALMDEAGAILYPVIHWSDLRSTPQAERLKEQCGDNIYAITYSQVNPSWTLTQLLWVKENRPEVWSKLRRILVTKDYVRYRFTKNYQTDVYDAIGTQLYDVAQNQWSEELCNLIGFDVEWLPDVVSSDAISGTLCVAAARDAHLPAGIPVAVGSGDSVIEALGIGAVEPGQCIVKLGTAANVNIVTAQAQPSKQSITYRHVVDENWFTITATNSGASTMRWFRDTFCRLELQQAEQNNLNVYDLIDQLAADSPAGAQGLIFHPYLMGERSPYWDPYLRGDFVGVSARHKMNHFARAILEGVAFSIRDCLQVVESLGQSISSLYLIGGGAKSRLWRQVLCDVLGRPLIKPAIEDAAFGAAVMAGIAVGVFADWRVAVDTCVQVEEILEPETKTQPLYDEYFEIYRDVTRDLAQHSHRLAKFTQSD